MSWATALGALKEKYNWKKAPLANLDGMPRDRHKTMCRQTLRNEVPAAGKPALSCRPAVVFIVLSWLLVPRAQLPRPTLGTRSELRQNAVRVIGWILQKRLRQHVGWWPTHCERAAATW